MNVPLPIILLWAACLPALQAGDSEKYFPVVIAPVYEFGSRGTEAGKLSLPSGVAVGKDDLLYVADAGAHRVQIYAMNGKFHGSFGSRGDGPGQFVLPSAIATSPEGDVFVADAGGRLQAFSPEGKFLSAWQGLRSPRGIAVAGDRLFVTEDDLHQVRILSRKGDPVRVVGGLGSQPGRFLSPTGIAVDSQGQVYVADTGNHRIQKLDPEGRPLAQWGVWGGQGGLMSYPSGLAHSNGRLTVTDTANHRVQVFDLHGALVRQWGSAPARVSEGAGRFHFPDSLAVSPSGGLTVVCEPMDRRIQVFVNRDLVKSTRVNDLPWWDGVHARLHSLRLAPPPPGSPPQKAGALAAPDVHAVFFFDLSSAALGPVVTAGGYGKKLGEFNGIGGVAVDSARDRAVVSDRGNRRIVLVELQRSPQRKDIYSGLLRVVGSFAMDRLVPKPPAEYLPERAIPGPLALDAQGRLYLLDRGNAAIVVCDADLGFLKLIPVAPSVRQFAVAPDGTIVATDPVAAQVRVYDADGRPKAAWGDGFGMPSGIAVDDQGFVYVADALLDCVKKFDAQGRFVKRWGETGLGPDKFFFPRAMTFSRPDRLIIDDAGNHRAQVCTLDGRSVGSYGSGGLTTPISIR